MKKVKRVKSKTGYVSISDLKKQADKWFSLATRYRFADNLNGEWVAECVTCKTVYPVKQLQCGHFQSRRFSATRYSEENTGPQCRGCNIFKQGEQFKFAQFIDDMYGSGTAKRLEREAHQEYHLTRDELEQIILDAKTEVDFYERGNLFPASPRE